MKKVILTGATSMIGVALIDAMLKHGNIEKIYAVIHSNLSNIDRLPCDKRIEILECNAENYYNLPKMINSKCDTFYHIAWIATDKKRNEDIYSQCNNIRYSLNAIDVAHQVGCKRFIGAGSQAEYGLLDVDRISPNSYANPIQAYGIAKYTAGKLVRRQAKLYGMNCLWVRVFSVYGKYDKPSTMISSTILKLKKGERMSFTPAEQRWDYLYSEDAGEAFYLLGEKAFGVKIYCLGYGEARPLKEYIYAIRNIINPTAEIGIGDISYPKNCVMNICADIERLVADTGWKPLVRFEDGITKILEAYAYS